MPVSRPRWIRRHRREAFVVVLLLLVGGIWLGLGLRSSATAIQSDAAAAQTSIEAVKAQLEAGDYARATESATAARAQVTAAADAAAALPVRIVGRLPILGTAVSDLDNLIGAATDLANASSRLVVVYGAATGKAAGGPKLFSEGRVDFTVLDSTATAVGEALAQVGDARTKLADVQGTLPGTHSMAVARDKALAQVTPLDATLTTMRDALRRMPDALGRNGSKSYLIAVLNPAELYPGGGAALSAALLTFTNGVLSIPLNGSLFPGNPRVLWTHVAGAPYYRQDRGAAFAFSDLYPDFAVTALEMQRSWVANGMKPVDGVITLDPIALAAALRVTGPVASAAYGEVNADNLVQKLLVDAYADFSTDQGTRHQLNDQLVKDVFGRLSRGSDALSIVKALASTAPGLHFRVHVDDPALQRAVVSAGLAGALPANPGDLLAVFTENQNGGKVDIFQKRAVTHDVTVKPDGSATVTTRVSMTNAVPASGRLSSDRAGYLTDWSYSFYLAHLPKGATHVSITAPRKDAYDVDDPTVYPDLLGRSIVRIGRWTAAGRTTVVTVTYTLPAGTFSTSSGLRYELTAMPQPLTVDATVQVTVRGPGTAAIIGDAGAWTTSGGVARLSGPFTQVSSTSVEWH